METHNAHIEEKRKELQEQIDACWSLMMVAMGNYATFNDEHELHQAKFWAAKYRWLKKKWHEEDKK